MALQVAPYLAAHISESGSKVCPLGNWILSAQGDYIISLGHSHPSQVHKSPCISILISISILN